MSKTKTVTLKGFVSRDITIVDAFWNDEPTVSHIKIWNKPTDQDGETDADYPVKLSYEASIPDRSVTITESEFDTVMNVLVEDHTSAHASVVIELVKSKLFGDKT